MLPSTLWSTLWSVLIIPLLLSLVSAQGPVQRLFPAAFPLAVKTPYLNTWYESYVKADPLTKCWPQFWTFRAAASVMGWSGKIRVNGTTYKWMGQDGAGTPANVTNIQVTPTRTIFVVQAGPMNVTITFLSPVEPDDWVKQSIPFSYVSVEVQSLNGDSYPVQLYSDISAEWASGDRSSVVQWSNANTGSSIYHEIQLQSRPQSAENENQAQDGAVYHAMSTSQSDISWQIDRNDTVRDGFQSNGKLTNTASTGSVAISPTVSVFALAVDLGTIQSTASPVTWSVGYVRDPSIAYTMPGGAVQLRRPYYIDAFTGDYSGAYSRAVALDQKIMGAAATISSQYSDIIALGTRQAMASLDFTVGTDSNNAVVPGDVKVFMKNLGSGNRVNPVEHIYAAFPMFLYLNASIGRALLEPLLEVQVSLSGQSFAAMDIGNTYPTAPGSDAVPQQGVEQSGNMLIMELAYARISGNGTFLSQYYNLAKRWADYLVSNALQSSNQTNIDGDTTNLANTALKGIIGVKVMAEIARVLGEDSDAVYYFNASTSLLSSWLSLATSSSSSHLLGSYGNQQSWSLMYNLFADKMLGLDFVPQPVIDMQTQYLSSLLATASQLGLSIDSESLPYGNVAWTLFTSAFVSNTTVRDALIQSVYNHANSNVSNGVFPERFDTTNNAWNSGVAGPALGAIFSHLTLTLPNQTISGASTRSQADDRGGSKPSTHAGVIAGSVVGGLAFVCLVIATISILARRKHGWKYVKEADMAIEITEQAQHYPTLTPYYQHSSLDDISMSGARSDAATAGFARISADDTRAYERTAVPPSLDLSAKARREATRTQSSTHRSEPALSESVSTAPNVSSQTGLMSSGDPLPGGSISATDVVGLLAEMGNLRRVVQELRAERLEPPPEYAE